MLEDFQFTDEENIDEYEGATQPDFPVGEDGPECFSPDLRRVLVGGVTTGIIFACGACVGGDTTVGQINLEVGDIVSTAACLGSQPPVFKPRILFILDDGLTCVTTNGTHLCSCLSPLPDD